MYLRFSDLIEPVPFYLEGVVVVYKLKGLNSFLLSLSGEIKNETEVCLINRLEALDIREKKYTSKELKKLTRWRHFKSIKKLNRDVTDRQIRERVGNFYISTMRSKKIKLDEKPGIFESFADWIDELIHNE